MYRIIRVEQVGELHVGEYSNILVNESVSDVDLKTLNPLIKDRLSRYETTLIFACVLIGQRRSQHACNQRKYLDSFR
jgi:hypothetical protein